MWLFQNVSNMLIFLLKIPSMEYIFMNELQSLFIPVYEHGLPWWLNSKEYACNAGDAGDEDSILR